MGLGKGETMARMEQDGPNGLSGKSENAEIIRAGGRDRIELSDSAFIADADIVRDGADLILRAPDGRAVTVEGYFNEDPMPVLAAPGGAHLSPALVESFVRADGPAQYAQGEGGNDVSPVGFVKEVSGHATVSHADGSVEPVTIGTPVFEGDIVETDASGAVNIRFVDESSFAISANARLAVDEYIFDTTGSDAGASSFSLLRGMFVYTSGLIGREDPDDVKIETPVGSIGIRGTTIAGHINPQGESQITVTEGAIVIRNAAGEQTLSQANATVRISGYDSPIQHAGVLSSAQIAHDYTVLRVVAPDFFTAIGTPSGEDTPDVAPEAGAPASHDAAPAPIQEQQPTPEQDGMMLLPEQNFDGAPVEFAMVTEEAPLSISAEAVSSTTTGILVPSPLGAAEPVNSYTQTLPPPSVIAGGIGTGTAAAPVLNLNALGANGIAIAGAVAGAQLGASVAAWGDGNHDGFDDFLIGNDLTTGGSLFAYNGALSALAAMPGNPSSGAVVAGIGDFDGDGQIDYAAGVPFSNSGAAGGGGVTIFASGSPIILNNMAAGQELGHSVAGIGDINGDGLADVAIGAPGSMTDKGAAYVIFGGATGPAIDITAPGADGFIINGIATNDRLGTEINTAGDFNRDGFADFAIAEPGQGRVHIAFGEAGISGVTLGTGTLQINGIAVDAADRTIPVMSPGDFNGDGISDILLAANGANGNRGEAYVVYGKASYTGGSTIDVNTMAAADGFKFSITDPASILDGGGAAGDFNGDGFDDIAVVLRAGSIADIYVVYGRAGVTGLTDAMLDDPASAFHMSYNVGNTAAFQFEIASAGDRNGDGFDDLVIGTPDANGGDGGFMLVFGRDNGTANTTGTALKAGDHLVGDSGNNTLDTAAFGNVHLNGGSGNDTLIVNNAAIHGADGGTGFDTLLLSGAGRTLDFSNAGAVSALRGSEALSGIEKFTMGADAQAIRLGLDDIFSLLQQSSDGKLRFTELGGGANSTALEIDNNGAGAGSFSAMAAAMGFSSGGTDSASDPGTTYNVYNFGSGYQLLIDTNIDNVAVV
jgi:hypothetical protein